MNYFWQKLNLTHVSLRLKVTTSILIADIKKSPLLLKQKKMLIQFAFICLYFCSVSCSKDNDLLAEYITNNDSEEIDYHETIDPNKKTIVLPSDFDWNNIPSEYANANWDINFDFDLKNAIVRLPSDVTLNFESGRLFNGTVIGDETVIVSSNRNEIFSEVSLEGVFNNEYIFPYWFGAIMDGVSDDREVFVETLKQSVAINSKVLVDQDIFLDVEETGSKSIFLDSKTWIEGVGNDTHIIINNLLSPAFYMALTQDITIKQVTFLYDQTYDANWGWDNAMHEANLKQLKDYMSLAHNVTFSSWNPWSRSPIAWRSVFSLEAAKNVLFENVTLKAKGSTADKFIVWGIKLKEQYNSDQTISDYNSPTSIPENIVIKNFNLDGVIMGIQGVVNGFTSDGITSYRYSDVQTLDGSSIGGNGVGGLRWMPPPHLFYLNPDTSNSHITSNVKIFNTIDYGDYVGTKNVRGSAGYCNSLKLVEGILNAHVENYKSYRRDGLWDLGAVTNGIFKNIYSEATSDIFESSWGFHNARFVEGNFANCTFENITVKDISDEAKIYPWNYPNGNSNRIENLNLYVKEYVGSSPGPFGIFGSNNTILNSSLNIEKHSSKQDYASVIFHLDSILDYSRNNHYEVVVNGWRKIDADPLKKKVRLIFARKVNPNSNYAKVTDVDNNFVVEQVNANETDTWVRSEIISLGQGNEQLLNTTVPAGFSIKKVEVDILENLANGITATIGFSTTQKDNLASNIFNGKSTIVNQFDIENVFNDNKKMYIFGNQNFNATGKIKVTIELVRKNISDW